MQKLRIWAVLLCVVALVGGLPLARARAADTVVRLTPAMTTISAGQTTTVTLHVQNVQDLYAYQVEITFDPAVLEVVDADGAKAGVQVVLGSWLQTDFVFQNSADNVLGKVSCALSQLNPAPAVSGSGDLLTITFRSLAAGASPVVITDLTLGKADSTVIPANQEDALIDVGQLAPPPGPTPTPTPPSGTAFTLRNVDVNGTTLVEVWVTNVENFYTVAFSLAFDEAIVHGVSVVEGPAFTTYPSQCVVTQITIAGGLVQFAGNMVCIEQSGDLHLATITLEDASCGTSPLTWQDTQLSNGGGTSIPHVAQDGSVTPYECPATITGQATLEGRTDHSGILVTLDTSPPIATTTDVSGTYTFENLASNAYTVTMSADLYLSAAATHVGAVAGEIDEACDVTLLGGDLNGDEIIDILDLALCGTYFGTSAPEADVTGNGIVDVYDLVLLGKNYLQEGPTAYFCGL